MYELNERIAELIYELRLSQNAFAKEIGTSSARISNICKKRNKPDSEFLQKVAKSYRNVSMDWLLLGEGQMFKSNTDDSNANNSANNYANNSQVDQNETYTFFNEEEPQPYGGSVIHGSNYVLSIDKVLEWPKNVDSKSFYRRLQTFTLPQCLNGNYILFEMSGDDMYPTILAKDWLVAFSVAKDYFKPNKVYVIVSKKAVFVLRAVVSGSKSIYQFKSDIDQSNIISFAQEEIKLAYEVVSKISNSLVFEDIQGQLDRINSELGIKSLKDGH